jgi:hypothetical protein
MQPWPLGKNYDGRATAVVIRCDDANVDLTDAIPRLQDLNFPPDNFGRLGFSFKRRYRIQL